MNYNAIQIGYKNRVIIRDLEINLEKGQVLGLIAPNGKGKSTLFKGIMNRLSTNQGQLTIENKTFHYPLKPKEEPELYQLVSIMPDQSTLIHYVSGLDHLKFIKEAWNSHIDIDNVIEQLKMTDYIKQKVQNYSLGMKQRLCFAMQIVMDTPIMLMDEIMNSLDIMNVELISDVLKELKYNDKILIIASHLLENLLNYSDQVLFILTENSYKLFDLHDKNTQYLKLNLYNPEDVLLHKKFTSKNFIKDYNNQFVKERDAIELKELQDLLLDNTIKSISISEKTLTEIYYELYMKE